MIKNMVSGFRGFATDAKNDPEFGAALETLKKKLLGKQENLDAIAHELLVPVKHTLKVEAAR